MRVSVFIPEYRLSAVSFQYGQRNLALRVAFDFYVKLDPGRDPESRPQRHGREFGFKKWDGGGKRLGLEFLSPNIDGLILVDLYFFFSPPVVKVAVSFSLS